MIGHHNILKIVSTIKAYPFVFMALEISVSAESKVLRFGRLSVSAETKKRFRLVSSSNTRQGGATV